MRRIFGGSPGSRCGCWGLDERANGVVFFAGSTRALACNFQRPAGNRRLTWWTGSIVRCAVHAARARHGTREGACSPRRMGAPRCLRLSNMPCHLHGFSLFKFEESLIWRARLRRVQYLISRKYLETTHSPRLLGAHCHEICFHFIRPPRNGFRGFGQYRADGRYPVRRDAAGHHADGCGLTGERSGRRHGGN